MRGKVKRSENKVVVMFFLLVLNLVFLLSTVLFVKYGIEPALVELHSKGDGADGL